MGSIYKRKWKAPDGTVRESAVWWIKYYQNGKPIRESTESEKISVARDVLRDREGDIVKGVTIAQRFNRIMLDELLTDTETEYEVNGRDTLLDLKRRLRLHIRPYFEGMRAAAITTADIIKFTSKRRNAGASNGEINRELSGIKRAYNLAIRAGKLLHKPHIPMLKEASARKGFFEREQFETVRAHLPEHVRPAITFAYITGWRIRSEVMSLRWDQVDFESAVVRLDPGGSKNEEPREFPFTDELHTLLEEQGRKADALLHERGVVTEHVFFFPEDGREIRDFRKPWRKACAAAGLAKVEEIGKTKMGKPILNITPLRIPHDFRRTAIRNLVRAGIHERLAMQMSGHKTRSVFERYNVTSGADLKEAAKKLNAFSKAHGHSLGTVAPKVSTPANRDLPVNPSISMPGGGIEPPRPLRGNGF